jgi:GxGYxYP putative glycoside hydrolase C-terminal domain/GxGYxY sequence motif in domain of unknown function N-terminal
MPGSLDRLGSVDRRGFLRAGATLLGAGAAALAVPGVARAASTTPASADAVQPYFPRGAGFQSLYVITDQELSAPEGVLVGTLQGLVARGGVGQTTVGATPVVAAGLPHIYISTPDSPTSLWLDDLQQRYGITLTAVHDAWDLLAKYLPRDGGPGITGYVLYDATDSVSISVATTLAGITGGVAVDASIENQATTVGLHRIVDVRGKDDSWVKANYWSQLRHDFAVEQKPNFSFQLRDLATMSQAMLFYDGNTPVREDIVGALDTDSPVIGWGDADQGESTFVSADSMAGNFEIAADWGRNIATLSGVPVAQLRQRSGIEEVRPEPAVHYVTFVVTDGDNAQWILTSLQNDPHWWSSPLRGTVNLGWGIPPTLLDLAPSVMRWYYDNESTGRYRDQFVVGPSGSGYLYPSQYPAEKLRVHTDRLNDYMARTDLRVVQILDFDALDKVNVWDEYTRQPTVDGLIYLEYSRYDGQAGKMVWSNGKPVISARHMLWGGLPGADETSVATAINAAPRDPTDPDSYTLVTVHAWSKTLQNIKTVVDQLAPDVRVVTPQAFTTLVTNNVAH